jgi:hypothetical protein
VLRGEGSVTGATGVSCESPFSVKSIFRLFLAVRIWNTNTTPQFRLSVRTVLALSLVFPTRPAPSSERNLPATGKRPGFYWHTVLGALGRLGRNLSSSPSLASHSLKTSSWALAVSNLKLLSFLILQIVLQRHIILSPIPHDSIGLPRALRWRLRFVFQAGRNDCS